MSSKPIATAPTDDEERILHLWCPELGSWEAGVFFESVGARTSTSTCSQAIAWREPPPSPPADLPDELQHKSQRAPTDNAAVHCVCNSDQPAARSAARATAPEFFSRRDSGVLLFFF